MTTELVQTIFWYVLWAATLLVTWKFSMRIKFDVNEYLRERRKNRQRKIDAILANKCPHIRLDQMGVASMIHPYGDGGQYQCEQCGYIFIGRPLEGHPDYCKGEGKLEEIKRKQDDFLKVAKKFGRTD